MSHYILDALKEIAMLDDYGGFGPMISKDEAMAILIEAAIRESEESENGPAVEPSTPVLPLDPIINPPYRYTAFTTPTTHPMDVTTADPDYGNGIYSTAKENEHG